MCERSPETLRADRGRLLWQWGRTVDESPPRARDPRRTTTRTRGVTVGSRGTDFKACKSRSPQKEFGILFSERLATEDHTGGSDVPVVTAAEYHPIIVCNECCRTESKWRADGAPSKVRSFCTGAIFSFPDFRSCVPRPCGRLTPERGDCVLFRPNRWGVTGRRQVAHHTGPGRDA